MPAGAEECDAGQKRAGMTNQRHPGVFLPGSGRRGGRSANHELHGLVHPYNLDRHARAHLSGIQRLCILFLVDAC
jgi:hypothetical protein